MKTLQLRCLPLATALAAVALIARADQRPNVLLICVDDLKPVLGCYDDPIVHSPNIDHLAAEGVRFDRAYCNQAVCAPSRNSLLTGLRPQTLGVYDLPTNFRKAAPDAVTLPQFFKQHGYAVHGLGKIFHQGHGNSNDEASWSVPHWRGPSFVYLLPESRGQAPDSASESTRDAAARELMPTKGAAFEAAEVADAEYPEGRLAELAVERINELADNADQPFFFAVGFLRPHLPFCAPKRYWDLYDPQQFALPELRSPPEGAPRFGPTSWGELRGYAHMPKEGPVSDETARTLIHGYYAAVSYVDAQIGRVLQALDDAGAADNTIVVLWGDHGWHLGDHGMWCKHTNYEQATRIPLIVKAPAQGAGGVAGDTFIESVDVYPTLCELAGLPAPGPVDGLSMAAVVADPSRVVRTAAIHVYPRGKVIGQAVRTDRYRLVEWKRPRASADEAALELYDYVDDPQESRNVADERPGTVAELRSLLAELPTPKPQLRRPPKQ